MNIWSEAFRGRRVLLTGHTGFKGGWLSLWLERLGAQVTGYSLHPPLPGSIAEVSTPRVRDVRADVRDIEPLERAWASTAPEVVFHLAAQPLVRESYRDPSTTVATNVVGTVNVMEVARRQGRPVVLVLVTSDKCYENHERTRGYAEGDQLGGHDVYSASKAAAEVLISSYRRSFFGESGGVRVASARAGNVIGGGDWSADRIVPDLIRAVRSDRTADVRSPRAVRPWQHVLEPLSGYLHLGALLLSGARPELCTSWNFGPEPRNTRTVAELVDRIIDGWGTGAWRDTSTAASPHEATLLSLDIEKARRELGWSPRWDFEEAVARTVEWYRAANDGLDVGAVSARQFDQYEARAAASPAPAMERV